MSAIREIEKGMRRVYSSKMFLQMPVSSRVLMTHLIADANKDGRVMAYAVMRMINATEDDIAILEKNRLISVLNKESMDTQINVSIFQDKMLEQYVME